LAVVGKAYFCGCLAEDWLRTIAQKISEKRAELRQEIESEADRRIDEVKFEQMSDYQKACKFRDGEGVDKDLEKAKALFRKCAESGGAEADAAKFAFVELSLTLDNESEKKTTVQLLGRLAEGEKYAPAQKLFGELLFANAKEKKTKDAIPELERAARCGSVDAMLRLGRYYANGEGFFNSGKNVEKAGKYLKLAAEKGSVEAAMLLRDAD